MTSWINDSTRPSGATPATIDVRVERQLRALDLAITPLVLLLLAVPMALGCLVGQPTGVTCRGRGNRWFTRWELRFPDTWVGRMFTRTGMAAWPTLCSVLKGDMAWVGHRAVRADAVRAYHPELARIRPGLISIWELRRRTAVHFGTELDADLEYLHKRGLRHDLGLILRALLVFWLPSPGEATAGRICVADVAFDNVSMAQAVERISSMLDGALAQQVSFVNPACVNIAARDRGYRRLLSRAAMVLPDGIGIKVAADMLGAPLKQNVNGTDLFPRLCEMFETRGASVFLLGGQAGVAERVADVMQQRWPQLRIAGLRDGFFSVAQEGEVAAQVRASGADVVLVARGVPMQDVFVDRHLHQLGVKVAIGVGGLFDFVSGRIHRAPLWMRDSGLEWIYRLLQEPSRMWRRYLLGNFTFLGRIALQRMGLRQSPDDPLVAQVPSRSGVGPDQGLRTVLFATAMAARDIPVATDFPAALLPYGWCSVVERVIEQLATQGIRQIDLVVSSRPEEFRQLLGQGERWGVQLRWHLAKDFATPYDVLRSMDLAPQQRLLLGHADRMVSDAVLLQLIEHNQIAALPMERQGVSWTGWASAGASLLNGCTLHSDEAALGAFLCNSALPFVLVAGSEFISVNSAAELLDTQRRALTVEAMRAVPATWLRTNWGAHSPDAVIQAGAHMQGPALIGPGCFIGADARIGQNTVLARDVVIARGVTVGNSLVLPQTFVGQGLELDQAIVNAGSVQHLRLGVRTVLPRSEGLLLDLRPKTRVAARGYARCLAVLACLVFLPWLAIDTVWRRARGLPLRWQMRHCALGRDQDSGDIRLQLLRCARTSGSGSGQLLAHYGGWLDVAAGRRTWFGSRPRSQSEWYALGRDWQLLLASAPVGCLHAAAWSDADNESLEAMAAADVFFAVTQGLAARLAIVRALLRDRVSPNAKFA